MMGDSFGMGFGGGFMWLFWILLIAVIVWAVKAVVGSGSSPTNKGKSALDILQERYARGESIMRSSNKNVRIWVAE